MPSVLEWLILLSVHLTNDSELGNPNNLNHIMFISFAAAMVDRNS